MSDFHKSNTFFSSDVSEILQTGNIQSILKLFQHDDLTTVLAAVEALFEILNCQGNVEKSIESPSQDEFRENNGIYEVLTLSKKLLSTTNEEQVDPVVLNLRRRVVVLLRVSARNPNNKVAINQLGGIHDLITLIQDSDEDVKIEAIRVLINLSAIEENIDAIREAGGLQILLHYFPNQCNLEDIAFNLRSDRAVLLLALLKTNINNQMALLHDTHGVVNGLQDLVESLRDPNIYVTIHLSELIAKLFEAMESNEHLTELPKLFITKGNGLNKLAEFFLPGNEVFAPLAINSLLTIQAMIITNHGSMVIDSILQSPIVFDGIVKSMSVPWNPQQREYAFDIIHVMFYTLEQLEDDALTKDLLKRALKALYTSDALIGLFHTLDVPTSRIPLLMILPKILNHYYEINGLSSVPSVMLESMNRENAATKLLDIALNRAEDEEDGGYNNRVESIYFLTCIAFTYEGRIALTTDAVQGIERVVTHLQHGSTLLDQIDDKEEHERHHHLMEVSLSLIEALIAENIVNQKKFYDCHGFDMILPFLQSDNLFICTPAAMLVRSLVTTGIKEYWILCRDLGILTVLIKHFGDISSPADLLRHAGAALSHLVLDATNKEIIIEGGVMSKLDDMVQAEVSKK